MESQISTLSYILSMSTYIIFLLLLVELMRKAPRFAAVFWLASLLTFPLWSENLDGWFRWVKTISVLVPTAIIVGGARIAWLYRENPHRMLKFFRADWVMKVLYCVIFLNIAEATLKDFEFGNYFNFVCGVVLCITMPFPRYKNGRRQYWVISKDSSNDVLFFSTAAWNFLYTTWNLAFIFGENPGYFASSFCILMAAELYPILKKRPELYLQARIYTLAFHVLARACHDIFTPVMDSSAWASETGVWVWGLVNVCLHVPYAIWYFYKKGQSATGEPPCGANEPPLIEATATTK